MEKIILTAKDLVRKGNIKEAIQILHENQITERSYEISVISSRIHILERKKRQGVLSNDEENVELNKIVIDLLSILEQFEVISKNEGSTNVEVAEEKSSNTSYKLIAYCFIFITLVFTIFLTRYFYCLPSKDKIDALFLELQDESLTLDMKKEKVAAVMEGYFKPNAIVRFKDNNIFLDTLSVQLFIDDLPFGGCINCKVDRVNRNELIINYHQ